MVYQERVGVGVASDSAEVAAGEIDGLLAAATAALEGHTILRDLPSSTRVVLAMDWIADLPRLPVLTGISADMFTKHRQLGGRERTHLAGRALVDELAPDAWASWNNTPPPETDVNYASNISKGEFDTTYSPTPGEAAKALNQLLIYTGLTLDNPTDPRVLSTLQTNPRLGNMLPNPYLAYPTLPGGLTSTPPVLPAVVKSTRLEPIFRFGFNQTTQTYGITAKFNDSDEAIEVPAEILYPPDRLNPISYLRDNGTTVNCNPMQRCYGCQFCERGYNHMTPDYRFRELDDLSPDTMAAFLTVKYEGAIDWAQVRRVSLVTGLFPGLPTESHMAAYLNDFGTALFKATEGAFDPHSDEQGFSVFTPWGSYNSLQEVGVKDVYLTAEMLGDDKSRVMQNRKGRLTYADTFQAVKTGLDTFGPDHFSVVYISGLDPASTAIERLGELKALGLSYISHRIHEPVFRESLALNRCSFPDLRRVVQFIENNFATQYT